MNRTRNTFFTFAIFFFILTVVAFCNAAKAGPSASLAWGWPLTMAGGDWNSCSGSTRLGLGYSWPVGNEWSLGITGGVRVPFNNPHFVPRVGVNAGYKINSWFAFGTGLLYEFIPNYTGGKPDHFIGLGLSPTILTKSGVGFSLVTGPGVAFGPGFEKPLWTWVIQPMLTFPF